MELNSKNIKRIIFIIFCGALIFSVFQNLGSVLLGVGRIYSIFSPVIAALCIAFVLNVLLTALENKMFSFMDKSKKAFVHKLKRPICIILTYLIALGLVSLLILVIIPDLIDTLIYIADKLPGFVLEMREWVETTLHKFHIDNMDVPELKINWSSLATTLKDWASRYSGKVVGEAVNITTSVFSGIFDAVFSMVISVYVLAQKEKIGAFVKRMLDAILPKKATNSIYYISSKANLTFSRFIGGQLTESLILGTLCFIGMSIFRFPNALIISVLVAVTSLVPIVGAAVGAIIGFLLILITSPIKAVFFVAFLIILQQIEGNLIYPKVVGKAVGLPGVIVVSAVLIGSNIGGVAGALFAVPVFALLFTLLKEFIDYANKQKLTKV